MLCKGKGEALIAMVQDSEVDRLVNDPLAVCRATDASESRQLIRPVTGSDGNAVGREQEESPDMETTEPQSNHLQGPVDHGDPLGTRYAVKWGEGKGMTGLRNSPKI